MNKNALLHVYGQHCEHDEVYIVGNREGLWRLKRALDKALIYEKGKLIYHPEESEEVMASDGEGYDVHVICNDTEWQGEYWKNLGLPYTASSSQDMRDDAIWPWMEAKK